MKPIMLTYEVRLEANQLSASKEAKLNYVVNIVKIGPNNKKPRDKYNNSWNKSVGNRDKGGYVG